MCSTFRPAFPRLLIGLLAGILLLASGASGRNRDDVSGVWEGAISIPGTELTVVIEFEWNDDEVLTGRIDIPMQGAKDVPLANVLRLEDKITFDLPGAPGEPRFDGTFSDDGQILSGDFTQSGATFPFTLRKKSVAETEEDALRLAENLSELDAFIDTTMVTWQVPGLAIAIIRGDEVIMSRGFGLRNVDDSLPVTESTLFAIGSSTKAFTTMAMGMLVYDGLLDWDEQVRTYLPTFKLYDAFASQLMTPRDLVTHRSGLPRHDFMWYGSSRTRLELFDRLRYLRPNMGFRVKFQYQNLMFMTAGYLLGQLTGSTWEDVVLTRIFQPLGMSNSNFSVDESQRSADFALPYRRDDEQLALMPFRNITTMGPAGSINSCVADMAKWVRLHIDGGKVGEVQLVSEATVAEMHTPQMAISKPKEFTERLHTSYGLGWFIESYRGHGRVYHGGNIDGFSALVSLLPRDELGMVVLTNLNDTPLPGIISLYAADMLLGLDPVDFHGRARARFEAAQKARGMRDETKEARRTDTKPAHSLEEYVGEYEHPAYGVIRIGRDGEKLRIKYNFLDSQLEHWHYEVFRATVEEMGDEKVKFRFLTNTRGDVDRISTLLESLIDEIVFERRAPATMSDPEFLARFVGEYDLLGQVVRVEDKDDSTLVAIIPGQPTYDLKPYRGTEYNLKGLTGFSVEFVIDGKDKVVEANFIQPNGIFTAVKIK